jgi:hypothetical protein
MVPITCVAVPATHEDNQCACITSTHVFCMYALKHKNVIQKIANIHQLSIKLFFYATNIDKNVVEWYKQSLVVNYNCFLCAI